MFRRYPPEPVEPQQQPPGDWAHGFCYLARQGDLHFGRNRRNLTEWRPVVSLVKRGELFQVLPATSHPHPGFFHLHPEDCFAKRAPTQPPHCH